MAKTFTGLKLQGDIGKFGKFDLSDVSAFAECEDGKVLSGSETGQLLRFPDPSSQDRARDRPPRPSARPASRRGA